MITEIPTADDFDRQGLNQLHLAWEITIEVISSLEQAQKIDLPATSEEGQLAEKTFWDRSQPALANALSLTQQAGEMALKGRVAAVSPYLLIGRDPKDWPRAVDREPVPFSEFRTIDTADLVKVHNSFVTPRLPEAFEAFWTGLRRDRNAIMHSVSPKRRDAGELIKSILMMAHFLFSDPKWPRRLLDLEDKNKYSGFSFGLDYSTNTAMDQIETALKYLSTSECKLFFGLDIRRRRYRCPSCYAAANTDFQEALPHLAQLPPNTPNATELTCVVCEETSVVERLDCPNPNCRGNVFHAGTCCCCHRERDDPSHFRSKFWSD
ncbi:hypothetical protein, partial [Nostoc linckia]|uniref:hypothetical protein n=1 Tax=Nostoc linckia TaxID=92942 RepID=UPI000BFFEE9E